MKIDLHCHSNASDGLRNPRQLVAAAMRNGVKVLALTDHDTTENLDAVRALCQETDIFFIPGIELSCVHQNESVHILGYFKDRDYQDPTLIRSLQVFREKRDQRAQEMARRLKQHYNIEVDLTQLDLPEGTALTRPHIAQLIQEKYRLNFHDIFRLYLGNHSKAYIPSSRLSIPEGLSLLKSVGAITILAHPGDYRTPLQELMTFAFDGVECYYPSHTKEATEGYVRLCLKENRLMTCGSDDHGLPGDLKHRPLGSTFCRREDVAPFLKTFGFAFKD